MSELAPGARSPIPPSVRPHPGGKLEARDLDAGYGKLRALSGVNFTAVPGSAVAVLGANGAGKSTLLKVLAGSIRPWSGSLTYDGMPVAAGAAWRLARRGVCYIPEGGGVFHDLTVRDNLVMAQRGGAGGEALEIVTATFPVLGQRLGQRAGSLSGGEKRMLALARALITKPRVLLVDEPSLGLAPVIVDQIFEVLDGLARGGMAVVIVEQFADRVLAISDYAWVLTKGRVAYSGDSRILVEDPALLERAYLGVSSQETAAEPQVRGPASAKAARSKTSARPVKQNTKQASSRRSGL